MLSLSEKICSFQNTSIVHRVSSIDYVQCLMREREQAAPCKERAPNASNNLSSGSCSGFQAQICLGGASAAAKLTPKLPETELLRTQGFP